MGAFQNGVENHGPLELVLEEGGFTGHAFLRAFQLDKTLLLGLGPFRD